MPTVADLPTGAKLKFGAYSVSGETPHKICWIKVHRDCTLLSEFIEEQGPFDVKEPENTDNYRKQNGNNRCSLSNVQQFLNADGSNWFHQMHEYDTPPEGWLTYGDRHGYNHKPGFLTCFEPWEIDAIEESEVKTALPAIDIQTRGEERYEVFYAKVFIPSKTNLYGTIENGVFEGEYWDLPSEGSFRVARLSPELYENTEDDGDKPDYQGGAWYYYLRTPMAHNSTNVRCVDLDDDTTYFYANTDWVGIRPALKLTPEIPVSDDPDEDGYYEVLSAPQEIIEIDEEVFLAILKTK